MQWYWKIGPHTIWCWTSDSSYGSSQVHNRSVARQDERVHHRTTSVIYCLHTKSLFMIVLPESIEHIMLGCVGMCYTCCTVCSVPLPFQELHVM